MTTRTCPLCKKAHNVSMQDLGTGAQVEVVACPVMPRDTVLIGSMEHGSRIIGSDPITDDQKQALLENEGRLCKVLSCRSRQPQTPGLVASWGDREAARWWADFGTCSREHAIDWYGPEAID